MGTLIDLVPEKEYSGLKGIVPDPDAAFELADYLRQIQNAINAMGGSGVTRQRGTATVVAGQVFVDVTYASAFVGVTVRIPGLGVVGQNVNSWVSAVGLTTFRLHISGILGVDCDVYWEAVGE